jgi:hypothetical protein
MESIPTFLFVALYRRSGARLFLERAAEQAKAANTDVREADLTAIVTKAVQWARVDVGCSRHQCGLERAALAAWRIGHPLPMVLAGEVDYLVTGDHRAGLLQRGSRSARIVTPAVFCAEAL